LAWRKLKSLKVTFAEIVNAVETSDKKRFALFYAPLAASAATGDTTATITPTPTTTEQEAAEQEAKENPTATESATATALAAATTDQNPKHYLIRATQGHSIKSVEAEALLERLSLEHPESLPETVVHGTYHAVWPLILSSGGLRCMGRNHVHFATGPRVEEVLSAITASGGNDAEAKEGERERERVSGAGSAGQVISGMRRDAQVLIYVDIRKALERGCPFWRSENGVILSEGMEVACGKEREGQKVIPVEFFDVVVERKKGLGKIWEGGEILQELPEELTRRGNPKGKGEGRGGGSGGKKR
ncbi:KptA family-domain-containing protein, partial [Aspergillus egyptiacus]